MSKTNLIEDELDLLIDSVLEAAPPDLKARCVKEDILVALRETCGIYDRARPDGEGFQRDAGAVLRPGEQYSSFGQR